MSIHMPQNTLSANESSGSGENSSLTFVAGVDVQGRLVGRWLPSDSIPKQVTVSTCALAWDHSQSDRVQTQFSKLAAGWPDLCIVPRSGKRVLQRSPALSLVVGGFAQRDGTACSIAPTTILAAQVERFVHAGFEMRVGFELEFYLFPTSSEVPPVANRRRQDVLDGKTLQQAPFVSELVNAFRDAGIGLLSVQTEWGRNQWEVSGTPTSVIDAADSVTVAKLLIRRVAASQGMEASFMAKPIAGEPGSSAHFHLSLHHIDGSPAADGLVFSAMSGVLAHSQELTLLYAPNVNSYRRIYRPYAGCAATWGLDNRTTTVRVIQAHSTRFEFRLPGADSNPYLSLAGVLASGLEGIQTRAEPPPPTTGDAYRGNKDEAWSLQLASRALNESAFARAALGDDVVDHLVEIATFEAREFEVAVTDWETARYADL